MTASNPTATTPAASAPVAATPPGAVEAYTQALSNPPRVIDGAHARLLLAVTGAVAIATDLLFNGVAWGLNVPVWLGLLVLTIVGIGARIGRPLARDRVAVLVVAVLLSSVFAWHDSETLSVFGFLAAAALVSLVVGFPGRQRMHLVSPVTLVLAAVSDAVAALTAEVRLVMAIEWRALRSTDGRRHIEPVLRALVIAVPLLLVFGALFAAADAVFAQGIDRIFAFDLSSIAPHVFWLLLGAWLASGVLWNTVGVELPHDIVVSSPTTHALGRAEIGIVLGSLALLFAAFVAVQLRYLFGGSEAVLSSLSLTYAEYARRGFFELVTAAVLLLPVLAALNWARRQDAPSRRLFTGLTIVMAALLAVVLASAWLRMTLYRETYGLTELRFYTSATLIWVAATVLWFVALVIRDRIELMLVGALTFAVVMLLACYVVSPDALIVRTNLDLAQRNVRALDVEYAASLGADALPPLIEVYSSLTPEDRCTVAFAAARYRAADDPRSWNLARANVASLLTVHPEVSTAGCSAPARRFD